MIFELRLGNGTGGFGPAVADQIGFGYDPTRKSTSTNPADYTLPRNTAPENADLFRVRSPNLSSSMPQHLANSSSLTQLLIAQDIFQPPPAPLL